MTLPHGLGIGIPHQAAEGKPDWYQTVSTTLPLNWWYNWTWPAVNVETGRVKMCYHLRDGAYLEGAIADANANPASGRLVGNELEDKHQGNTDPATAARNANRWVRETSNPWAIGGNLFLTPWEGAQRHSGTAIAWLDAYLDAGGPVPYPWRGCWHMHAYCYAGTPEDDFDRQIDVQAEWMVRRGVVRPVIVSETCWLYDDVAMQARLMRHLLRRIQDGTIQAAAWSQAGGYDVFDWASLLTGDGQMTNVGQAWVDVWEVSGQAGSGNTVWLPQVGA